MCNLFADSNGHFSAQTSGLSYKYKILKKIHIKININIKK